MCKRDCGGDLGPRQGCTEDRMYSTEQRKLAIETYIKFDLSAADTIAELGHPTRLSLRAWYKDYLEHGEVKPPKRQREPKFTLEMRQAAVDHYLAHGGASPGPCAGWAVPPAGSVFAIGSASSPPGRGDTGGRARRRTLSRWRRRHGRRPSSSPAPEPPRRSRRARRVAHGALHMAQGDNGR